MGFLSLFFVASMPVIQFLLICLLGAFLASGYSNILSESARRDINKVSFYIFYPAIVFSSLAKTVTLQDLISWWFMPVSIGMTFLIGGILGWIIVKILRPERHFEGLIIGCCSAANMGYLPLVLVPAICDETGSPFGETSICQPRGLSYVALSMSFSSVLLWTHTYSLMRKSGVLYQKTRNKARTSETSNKDFVGSGECDIIEIQGEGSSNDKVISVKQSKDIAGHEEAVPLLPASDLSSDHVSSWGKLKRILERIVEELLAPPTIAAIIGLVVGVIPSMKSLIIGSAAPLRVVEETTKTLGNAVLPCVTLILGGNLLQGLRNSQLKPLVIVMIVFVRNVILPIAGVLVVKAANHFGLLAEDPLYHYVLMLQFALPPATSLGSMAQLFDVAKEECSVIFLWTYLASAFTLTIWTTVFMWLLSVKYIVGGDKTISYIPWLLY